jgi:hypothetical protein
MTACGKCSFLSNYRNFSRFKQTDTAHWIHTARVKIAPLFPTSSPSCPNVACHRTALQIYIPPRRRHRIVELATTFRLFLNATNASPHTPPHTHTHTHTHRGSSFACLQWSACPTGGKNVAEYPQRMVMLTRRRGVPRQGALPSPWSSCFS